MDRSVRIIRASIRNALSGRPRSHPVGGRGQRAIYCLPDQRSRATPKASDVRPRCATRAIRVRRLRLNRLRRRHPVSERDMLHSDRRAELWQRPLRREQEHPSFQSIEIPGINITAQIRELLVAKFGEPRFVAPRQTTPQGVRTR